MDSAGKIYLDLSSARTSRHRFSRQPLRPSRQFSRSLPLWGRVPARPWAGPGQGLQQVPGKGEKPGGRAGKGIRFLGRFPRRMRQNAVGLFNGVQDPGAAAQRYIESTRAYQELLKQQEAVRARAGRRPGESAHRAAGCRRKSCPGPGAGTAKSGPPPLKGRPNGSAQRRKRAAAAAERAAQREQAAAEKGCCCSKT